ncbi:hypothetical protein GXM_04771 [Nostoc sphaeroides CCNUC1]|uniref:Uncharacterized protein n=1 Tax=Nostoc sphaeroides CCNUC1 TaxID=2653204 RepID=A0A5P8W467_9NOSO|nr:hypothetical protein GXM_04771 [Nostoc sphaeroides CCNUC1]
MKLTGKSFDYFNTFANLRGLIENKPKILHVCFCRMAKN